MAELKTKKNNASVSKFIDSIENEQRRKDAKALLKIYKDVLGVKPKMWGDSIVGFGSYHYESERSSQKGDWPAAGFSPRKQSMTLYFMNGFGEYKDLLKKIGKHTNSVSCLYVKKLEDLDEKVLRQMIKKSYNYVIKSMDQSGS